MRWRSEPNADIARRPLSRASLSPRPRRSRLRRIPQARRARNAWAGSPLIPLDAWAAPAAALGEEAQLIFPNQPRRSIHFASSSTGETVLAARITMTQSISGRLNVPMGLCKNGR
jgi:hypothetical protein